MDFNVIKYHILPFFDLENDYWIRNKLRLTHPYFAHRWQKRKIKKYRTVFMSLIETAKMADIYPCRISRRIRIFTPIMRLNRDQSINGLAQKAIISDKCCVMPQGIFGETLYCYPHHLTTLNIVQYRIIIIRNVTDHNILSEIIDRFSDYFTFIYGGLPTGIIKIDTTCRIIQFWEFKHLCLPINRNVPISFYCKIEGVMLSYRFGGAKSVNSIIKRYQSFYFCRQAGIIRPFGSTMSIHINCFYHIKIKNVNRVLCTAKDVPSLIYNYDVDICVIAGDINPLVNHYNIDYDLFIISTDYKLTIRDGKIKQVNLNMIT